MRIPFSPKTKNNKASSLTNLFRNQGGSFGIAFVTTLLARRTQYHHALIAEHVTAGSPCYRALQRGCSKYLMVHGLLPADAALHAGARLALLVQQQAAFQAFMDCFTALGWIALIGVPLFS